jgi:hypothetical protein
MISAAQAKKEHAAYLTYIRTAGLRVSEEATFDVNGRPRPIKEYIRDHWPAIKEQRAVARVIVDAIETETGVPFEADADEEAARAA